MREVIILGSGPAGYTAALYAARANLSPLVFSGLQPGGQLTITTDVENYPGFPAGVQGPDLMDLMRAQVVRFGAEVIDAPVESVDFSARPFRVRSEGREYVGRSVIVATGASALLLGLPSEEKFMGFGVSACATCDGFLYKGKRVIVIGGGDTAMEEANFLTRFCPEVIVVHRRDHLRASKIMQDRARANERIRFIWNTELAEVFGEEGRKVTRVRLRNVTTGKLDDLDVDAVFVAIGHRPNTKFLDGQLELDASGYIIVRPGSSYTSTEGVFAAGDVHDKVYRQAVTAAGTGCMAAIDCERWLEAQGQPLVPAAGAHGHES